MQDLVSVMDDGTGMATPTEEADLDMALKRAAERSKAGYRTIEVRPLL